MAKLAKTDAFYSFVEQSKIFGGETLDEDWLLQIWTGADGNSERAINHLLDTPDNKKMHSTKSSTRKSSAQKRNTSAFDDFLSQPVVFQPPSAPAGMNAHAPPPMPAPMPMPPQTMPAPMQQFPSMGMQQPTMNVQPMNANIPPMNSGVPPMNTMPGMNTGILPMNTGIPAVNNFPPTMNTGMMNYGMQPAMSSGMPSMHCGNSGLQPTMNGMSGMQPTMNGMSGMQPTMNGMSGMQPTMNGMSGMQPTMNGMSGMQPTMNGMSGMQPTMNGMSMNTAMAPGTMGNGGMPTTMPNMNAPGMMMDSQSVNMHQQRNLMMDANGRIAMPMGMNVENAGNIGQHQSYRMASMPNIDSGARFGDPRVMYNRAYDNPHGYDPRCIPMACDDIYELDGRRRQRRTRSSRSRVARPCGPDVNRDRYRESDIGSSHVFSSWMDPLDNDSDSEDDWWVTPMRHPVSSVERHPFYSPPRAYKDVDSRMSYHDFRNARQDYERYDSRYDADLYRRDDRPRNNKPSFFDEGYGIVPYRPASDPINRRRY